MPEDKENLYDKFTDWLAEQTDGSVTATELLELVKGVVVQLRQSLTSEEVSLAFAHCVAFVEAWLREKDYIVLDLGTGQPERLITGEERRFGSNNPLEINFWEDWVPDELPDWLTGDGEHPSL